MKRTLSRIAGVHKLVDQFPKEYGEFPYDLHAREVGKKDCFSPASPRTLSHRPIRAREGACIEKGSLSPATFRKGTHPPLD